MKCNGKMVAIMVACAISGVCASAMDKPNRLVTKVKKAFSFKLTPEEATQELRKLISLKNTKKISIKDVAKLIEAGADINVKSAEGITALEMAAEQNNSELVAYLLKKGANPNIGIPLVRSAANKNEKIVKQLIQAGAMQNQYQDGKISALWHAVYHADPEMVRLLLEAGADANVQTTNGNTPLHLVLEHLLLYQGSRNANIAIVRMLLAYGADITQENGSKETPLDIARAINDKELLRLFTIQRKQKIA